MPMRLNPTVVAGLLCLALLLATARGGLHAALASERAPEPTPTPAASPPVTRRLASSPTAAERQVALRAAADAPVTGVHADLVLAAAALTYLGVQMGEWPSALVQAYTEALALARGNRVVAAGLVDPLVSGSPDNRPAYRSAAATSTVPPPTDPFIDATATYAGAVAPANGGATNVPWYAGWTRGWTPAP